MPVRVLVHPALPPIRDPSCRIRRGLVVSRAGAGGSLASGAAAIGQGIRIGGELVRAIRVMMVGIPALRELMKLRRAAAGAREIEVANRFSREAEAAAQAARELDRAGTFPPAIRTPIRVLPSRARYQKTLETSHPITTRRGRCSSTHRASFLRLRRWRCHH